MIKGSREREMKTVGGRDTAALLNPRPAVLVTCCDVDGRPNVLSVAWQTPLSHEPPMVGISVGANRFSHRLIEQIGEFAVNVVDESFREAVALCGNLSGRDVDKFSAIGLSVRPAHRIRPPLIAGALAHLECTVEQSLRIGGHTLFVGVVRYAEACKEGFTDAWAPYAAEVLLCVQRDRYATWTY